MKKSLKVIIIIVAAVFLTAGAAIGVIYFFGGQEQPTETVSKPKRQMQSRQKRIIRFCREKW